MDQGQYENNVNTQYNGSTNQYQYSSMNQSQYDGTIQPQYSENMGQSQYNNTMNQYNNGQVTKNTWVNAILVWVLVTQFIITASRIVSIFPWIGYGILHEVLLDISIYGCAVIILNMILDIVCMVCSMRQSKKNSDGKYGGKIFMLAIIEMLYGLSSLFIGTLFWALVSLYVQTYIA